MERRVEDVGAHDRLSRRRGSRGARVDAAPFKVVPDGKDGAGLREGEGAGAPGSVGEPCRSRQGTTIAQPRHALWSAQGQCLPHDEGMAARRVQGAIEAIDGPGRWPHPQSLGDGPPLRPGRCFGKLRALP